MCRSPNDQIAPRQRIETALTENESREPNETDTLNATATNVIPADWLGVCDCYCRRNHGCETSEEKHGCGQNRGERRLPPE